MLATKGDHVPPGGWTHEVKWDGMRVLVETSDARGLRIYSRNENDVTVSFPELHGLAAALDGRTTSCSTARSSRWATGCRRSARSPTGCTCATPPGPGASRESNPVTLIAFDLLRLDGQDLCRAAAVRAARPAGGTRPEHGPGRMGPWQVPPTYDDGQMLLVRGRAAGPRGHRQQAAVLAVPPRPAQPRLAEVPDPPDRLVRGRRLPSRDREHAAGSAPCWSGSRPREAWCSAAGSAAASPARPGSVLAELLEPLVVRRLAVHRGAAAARPGGHRVGRPAMVVDVQYLRLTTDGRLRQPAYRGVRTDLSPSDLEEGP